MQSKIPLYHYVASPIIWLLFLALRTVLIAAGFLVVPVALLFGTKVRESKFYAGRQVRVFRLPLAWLWANEEEGVGWYGDPAWPLWRRILYSECIRNPANNLRFVPGLSLIIEPAKVLYYATPVKTAIELYDEDSEDFTYFAWQGLYSCIRWQGHVLGSRRRFWIGFKLYPEDQLGIPDWDHRKVRAGFATQFRRLK